MTEATETDKRISTRDPIAAFWAGYRQEAGSPTDIEVIIYDETPQWPNPVCSRGPADLTANVNLSLRTVPEDPQWPVNLCSRPS